MTQFKTIRGEVLNTGNLRRLRASPALKRLALAASDYRTAVLCPEWAKENGGVEGLVMVISRRWHWQPDVQGVTTITQP